MDFNQIRAIQMLTEYLNKENGISRIWWKYTDVALETDLPDELQCQVSFDLRESQKVTIAAAQKCIACN